MTNPNPRPASVDPDDLTDLPDDLLEGVEDTPAGEDEFGDETQGNEERTALEGLEQNEFIDPRGEDDSEDDSE